MTYYGLLCKDCKKGCVDAPSPESPVYIECPTCREAGCEHCNDTGRIEITTCPRTIPAAEDYEVIEAAELYEKGLPPIAGGSRDQARWFVSAARFVWSEKAEAQAHEIRDIRRSNGKV